MAAFPSADRVREMVAQDEQMIVEEKNEETTLVHKMKTCLEEVATSNIDVEVFVSSGV